jgi:uncharacterized membrane-anchored protein
MIRNRLLISAIVLALLQIGFLSWIIASRAAILRFGQEVLLKVEPVDPRDLLRGDYVRLGYDISAVPVKMIVNPTAGAAVPESGPIWVRLEKGADGFWQPVSASLATAFATAPAAGQTDVRGTVLSEGSLDGEETINVDYGISRFYLPEGEGRAIEQDMRVRSFGILAAVAKDGTLQIKGLMDGEKMLFSEPLY